MNSIVLQLGVFTLSFLLFFTYSGIDVEASPLSSNGFLPEGDDETRISTGAFLRFLEDLLEKEMDERHDITAASAKRGLDLGLSRGFSGSQAAKHLMGLAAANFAGGPGRRRRSSNPQRLVL